MKKTQVKAELEKKQDIDSKYLMGTKAFHLLGPIGSDEFVDIFRAYAETPKYWVGAWVTGFGFVDVLFPKDTSRELTDKEKEKYGKSSYQIGSQPSFKLKID